MKQPKPVRRLRVLTFNVNYGGNIKQAIKAILQSRADVVALQETTRSWPSWAAHYLGRTYPYRQFAHAPGAGGMGVLSRFPLLASKRLPPRGGGWFDAWLYKLKTPLGAVQMLNVHLRPPLGEDGRLTSIPRAFFATRTIRRAELQAHLQHIVALPANKRARPCEQKTTQRTRCLPPTIVLGDFNENRQGLALRWLRKKRRMRSALQKFDRTSPTWEWPTALWTFRDRLDHVMVSPHFRMSKAQVLPAAGSDHFPLLVVLQE